MPKPPLVTITSIANPSNLYQVATTVTEVIFKNSSQIYFLKSGYCDKNGFVNLNASKTNPLSFTLQREAFLSTALA